MVKIYQRDELRKALLDYKKSDIIAFPTDTVYGIGGNIFNKEAIHKIYHTKHRPSNKPLPILCANIEQIFQVAKNIPKQMEKLIYQFMPGALTVILPKKDEIPNIITSHLPTIGVRIPNHPLALELLEAVGPLATTSANISGQDNISDAKDVIKQLGNEIDIVIDGGKTKTLVPSTVVAIENDKLKIFREGAISKNRIESCLKK